MDSKIELMQWMIKIMDAQNPRAQFCLLSFYRARLEEESMGRLFKNKFGRWEVRAQDGSVLSELVAGDEIELENMFGRMIATRVEFNADRNKFYTVNGIDLRQGLFARVITREVS